MMIRFYLPSVLAVAATGFCCALLLEPPVARAADNKVDFPAPSSHSVLKQRIGVTDIEIDYSRPNKNSREIFGHLVPYGAVWRTGANDSTKVTFSGPVNFGGKDIPAGKYSLYTIPAAGEWTVIIYKDPDQWGAYKYKQADDVARVTARAEELPFSMETFTIDFADVKENSADLYLAWDKVIVRVPLSVDTVARMKTEITRVAGTPDATPQFYAQAANYYLVHDLDPASALKWIDIAIQTTPDAYGYYGRKASIQSKLGDKTGALASAEKAVAVAKSRPNDADADTVATLTKLADSLR